MYCTTFFFHLNMRNIRTLWLLTASGIVSSLLLYMLNSNTSYLPSRLKRPTTGESRVLGKGIFKYIKTWYTHETDQPLPFLMSNKEASKFHLKNISKIIGNSEPLNTTNLGKIKLALSRLSNPSAVYATKLNMGLMKRTIYALQDDVMQKIPRDIFNFLPHDTPLQKMNIPKCSVVGSSGILNNSSCGKRIDSADFVIRFNVPPLSGFELDAGSKSNITTLNPSQITKQFQGLKGYRARHNFLSYLQQYRHYLWFPGFATESTMHTSRMVVRTFTRTLRYGGMTQFLHKHVKLMFGNPRHWRSMTEFWRTRGVKGRRLTSGIYWVAIALAMCDEVNLYGFWPFPTNSLDKPLRYHYYADDEPSRFSSVLHSFGDEFNALLKLHVDGVLKLHVEKCS